jgi:hypothetical protein
MHIPVNSYCYVEGLINSWEDHAHLRIYICISVFVYIYIYIHIYTHIKFCIFTNSCMYVYICIFDDMPMNSYCHVKGLINSWEDHTHVSEYDSSENVYAQNV